MATNHYLIKQDKGVARVHKHYEVLRDAVTQCLSNSTASEVTGFVWFVLSTARDLPENRAVEPIPIEETKP